MSYTHYSGMHSNSHVSSPRAYTLVELIVVIAILVVLSTVGFVGYSQYTASSRDGARVSDLRAIYQGIGVSVSQKGIAPAPDIQSLSTLQLEYSSLCKEV
jgi:prepilin-type N-terminal cleavage/methylation domain-containing protein